jgi:hypothetical protein
VKTSLAAEALVPAVVVTVMKYVVPVVMGGETAVIEFEEFTVTLVAARAAPPLTTEPPDSWVKVTVAPVMKPVPAIVTAVPPLIEPVFGLMLVTVGEIGVYVKMVLGPEALVPVGVLTVTK